MDKKFIVSDTASSGNDEFYTPYYALLPLIKYLRHKNFKSVYCPFDTADSRIVKGLKAAGFLVKFSHIDDGVDFFEITDMDLLDVDIVLSNPPYSVKGEVFDKLFKLDKPFAMLVGIVGLFESKIRFNLFKNNAFEVMYLDKRVAYHSDFNTNITTKSPPFSSCWVCSKTLQQQLHFEELNKKVLSLELFEKELLSL